MNRGNLAQLRVTMKRRADRVEEEVRKEKKVESSQPGDGGVKESPFQLMERSRTRWR